jgi:type IV secretory pathway VirB6-like protein
VDRLFTAIEQAFGRSTLVIAIVLFIAYFLGEGFSKLLLSVRDFSSEKRRLEREKQVLEVLKLRCDIEALKKTHGLDYIELPELKPFVAESQGKKTAVPLARALVEFLMMQGVGGRILLLTLMFPLQFISVFLTTSFFVLTVPELARAGRFHSALSEVLIVSAIYVIVVGTTGYLGFYVVKRRLAVRAARVSRMATVVAVASAIVCAVALTAALRREERVIPAHQFTEPPQPTQLQRP